MYEDFCRSEFEQKRKEQHLSADEHYYCFTPQYVAGEAALLFKAGFAEVRVCWAKSNTACFLPQNKQITVEKPVELRTNKRYAS